MSKISDKARELYLQDGYCCSESVWLAFAQHDDLDIALRDTGNRLAFAFCGGTGAAKLCGALAGGILVLGNRYGRTPGQDRNPELAKYTKELIDTFESHYHKINCKDLKPVADPALCKQVCAGYLSFVVQAIEDMHNRNNNSNPTEICA